MIVTDCSGTNQQHFLSAGTNLETLAVIGSEDSIHCQRESTKQQNGERAWDNRMQCLQCSCHGK